ncbi:hypothetical protein [Nannocystis sp. SCPEA4]|uniref:hypothetical protein n=1 Tax=Nannocystis sp. SCPEA4 TaxID=2996787 RepID=UPI002271786B|nr:hypothetical protein [Nannocystis sp. SCPEA4]MCY1061652.1 hypothetical protein [Nannocystis sp. SCPEA4]
MRAGLTSLLLTLAFVACGGGKTESSTTDAGTGNPDTVGTTATGTTGPSTPTTGATTTTTNSSTSTSTTTASTTTDALTTDALTSATTAFDPDCPPGYSPGCCEGDGGCCPCVGFNCADNASSDEIEQFQDCTCQADVCADACSSACAGDGIDVSCFVCADKAGQTTCAAEFAGCGGGFAFTCPPETCDDCRGCARTGACYDAWFACWSDSDCRELLIYCVEYCTDAACEQACNEEFPAGAALHQAYLDCAYCDSCADLCDIDGVACGP